MLGNTLAILCAVSWSLSVILLKMSGAQIHPLALNLIKNVVGLVFLGLSAWIFEGTLHWPERFSDTKWLLLSGFLGIGLADGLILKAMQHLRASHVAILECLFAPFVIILSVFRLQERPTPLMLIGGALIIGALFCVSHPEEDRDKGPGMSQRTQGIILMAIGLFLIAYGIVIVKPLFDTVPLFSLVTIRMLAGVLGSVLFYGFLQDRRVKLVAFLRAPNKSVLFAACFLSSYLSILLWVAGYKYLQATVAALLNQTSTVFTVIFAVIFLKEKFTRAKLIATGLAMSGVALITLGT
jgi:drug/metabolite transporter (DMT)-like permease